jgi:uncharacterized membrane protein
MNQTNNRKPNNWILWIFFLQVVTNISILFDVPIARQVLGFCYFTFLPGFIILKLLKVNELDKVETILFSVGLSIAFLMVVGLLINEFSFMLGFPQPLSLLSLMTVLNSLILIGGVLVYLKSEVKIRNTEPIGKSPLLLLFLCLPVLSIIGAIWAKTYESNLILLLMITLTAFLFALGVILKKNLPSKFYPLIIFIIAISLLYHSSLISDNLIHFGSDMPGEVFAFKVAEKNAHWSPVNPYPDDLSVGRTYAMLSVTVLPMIYSSLLNLNVIWIFKLLNPILFALVPLGLYILWSKFISAEYAFVSAFFFMAYNVFYTEILGLNKQMIGELFFVLLWLVILNKKIRSFNKTLCFLIFSFALVVSHYALAEIFLFFISFILISLIIMKKPRRNITLAMVLCFLIIMFSWYLYTSNSAVFDAFLQFGEHVRSQLSEFFNPAAREQTVLRGLGLEAPPTIWNMMGRIFAYTTQLLIVVGFVGVIMKRVGSHFEIEYFLLILFSAMFLVALILVPGLANTMNMTRFYHILLFSLAPLCALGAKTIMNIVSRRKTEMMVPLLLLTVLVPYFLFQVGLVYEVTGNDSWSVPLSEYRLPAYRLYGQLGYTTAYSISGAEWVSENVAVEYRQIYADAWGRVTELRAYGSVYVGHVATLSNTTRIAANGVVYLSSLNIIEEIVVGSRYVWNPSELDFLSDLNAVYSNGGCEAYKNTP